MNKFITQTFIATRWILFLFFFCSLMFTAGPAGAETTVTNSVRVSADGNGENHASVTTIVNGEVIEDWSATSTEPIVYSSSYTESDDSTTVNTSVDTNSQTTEQSQLKALIAQLEALISFYVSLLNH